MIFRTSFWLFFIYFCPFFLSKMSEYSYRIHGTVCRIRHSSVPSWSSNFTKNLLLQTVQEDSEWNLTKFTMNLLLYGLLFRSGTVKRLEEFSGSFVKNVFSAAWLSLTHLPQSSWRGQIYRQHTDWSLASIPTAERGSPCLVYLPLTW